VSEREWKPGDVATFGGSPAFRTVNGWAYTDGSVGGTHQDDYDPRPLVVIDAEDAEQVERLLESLRGMSFAAHACGAFTCLRAALREFANPTPPKPDEPTGLGAVVETANGYRWLHAYCDAGRKQWIDKEGRIKDYEEIAAVRVLSEGVPS
jgi:hypothetical protein